MNIEQTTGTHIQHLLQELQLVPQTFSDFDSTIKYIEDTQILEQAILTKLLLYQESLNNNFNISDYQRLFNKNHMQLYKTLLILSQTKLQAVRTQKSISVILDTIFQ